ncbi:MAG: hypothetical protein ACTSR8_11485 [Promethearchaeota archaeon]
MKDKIKEFLVLVKKLIYFLIIGIFIYFFLPKICIFTFCINIFRVYYSIVIIGLIFYYIFLPLIFKYFVSPKFNASYLYSSKDFKEKRVKPSLTQQLNTPLVSINKENGIYEISFGEKRELIEGSLQVFCDQQLYSNKRSLSKGLKNLILIKLDEVKGNDDLGGFKRIEIVYELPSKNKKIIAKIKEYPNQNFIIFELEFPDGLSNTHRGKYKNLITQFPSFLNKSFNTKIFTYRHAIFCPPNRKLEATSSPVVFYDDDLNTFTVCALDGFLNTVISQGRDKRISCGFQGELNEIPANTNQKFIILFNKGINNSLEELGVMLRKYHKVERKEPYSSIAVSHLSYWTDNGAYYYYQREKGLSYEDTMVDVKNYFEKNKIPFKSYNFDSWWYLKYQSGFNKFITRLFKPLFRILGGGLFGNTIRWEADPEHFSTDLATFYRERFKYPIIAHSRRWDARSPYLEKYEFEVHENHAIPLKIGFWEWCMRHAKESGIDIYEQDWMKNQVKSLPVLREKLSAQEEWLNNMATAARENEVDVFYCMMTPGMILYSIKHPNIIMARCSGDYNHRWPITYRFIHATQTCILFNAVRIHPHQDVFRSHYELLGEHYPEFKCLVEILTSGVVAPGDKKERVNWSLLKKTCRDDGLLLKPDKPLTANDLMFKKHRKYYICDTYTRRNDLIWRYILVTNVWPKRVKDRKVTLEELGFEEEFVLYDYYLRKIVKIAITKEISIGILKKYQYKYFILSPILKNGMALIGCVDKFVCCSKKQFPLVQSTANTLTFSIEDIENSEVSLILFSEHEPSSVESDDCTEISWDYDPSNYKIKITLKFKKQSRKKIIIKS